MCLQDSVSPKTNQLFPLSFSRENREGKGSFLKQMKILIVDDSLIARKTMGFTVEALGYETLLASNGDEALQALAESASDVALVLLDWNMPGLNGLDVLKNMQDDKVFGEIPVMMVTTEVERESMIAAIKAGAKHYLCKPFTGEELSVRIHQCLGKAEVQNTRRAFTSAITDVVRLIVGEAPKVTAQAKGERFSLVVDYCTRMVFRRGIEGFTEGFAQLTVGKATAQKIVRALVGDLEVDMTDEILNDGLGEFLNMIMGTTKARLTGAGLSILLSAPQTAVGEKEKKLKTRPVSNTNQLYVEADFGPFIISYRLHRTAEDLEPKELP